jgi:nicotinate phosphoribosyltransferase
MKAIFPGRKQVYRHYDAGGRMHHDMVAGFSEACSGTPLLQPVMKNGTLLPAGAVPLAEARTRTLAELQRLPDSLRALTRTPSPYPVEFSQALQATRAQVRQKLLAPQ